MTKFEYFKLCMDHQAYRSKAWVISAFSVVMGEGAQKMALLSDVERDIDKLRLKRDAFGKVYFNDLESGAAVYLDDTTPNEAPFKFSDAVALRRGDVINLDRDVETTYGAWLFNNIVVVYPFGSKIPFSPNGYMIRELEKIIEKRLADNLPEGSNPVEGDPLLQPIYVDEYIKYNEAAGSLTGFTQLCVPAATPFTITIDPAILKRRDELLAEYKDQLDDPVIQARISKELIQMDRDWIAQDPDRGFFFRDKSFDVVRKKQFLFLGSDAGFEGQGKFVTRSLDEGISPEDIPDMANSQRFGSYARGAQTALGGEATKFNLRMFQNSQVIPGDCGSVIGKSVEISKENVQHLIGNYYITKTGLKKIEDGDQDGLIGKTLQMRAPMFCLAADANYCATCVGDRIASTPDALSTYAADIGSTFMLAEMKKTHGRALHTAIYDFKKSIR